MLKLLIFPLAAAAALAVGGGVYWRHVRQIEEEKAGLQGIVAAAMLYNVRQSIPGREPVEFHSLPSGALAACGVTFTAISEPDNSAVAFVVAGRARVCDARDDIVYTAP